MSASAYTHRRQVLSRARVVKVEYQGGRATNYNPIYSVSGCNPDYSVIDYQPTPSYCFKKIADLSMCATPNIPPTFSGILDGEFSYPIEVPVFDGGYSYGQGYPAVIDGGNS